MAIVHKTTVLTTIKLISFNKQLICRGDGLWAIRIGVQDVEK